MEMQSMSHRHHDDDNELLLPRGSARRQGRGRRRTPKQTLFLGGMAVVVLIALVMFMKGGGPETPANDRDYLPKAEPIIPVEPEEVPEPVQAPPQDDAAEPEEEDTAPKDDETAHAEGESTPEQDGVAGADEAESREEVVATEQDDSQLTGGEGVATEDTAASEEDEVAPEGDGASTEEGAGTSSESKDKASETTAEEEEVPAPEEEETAPKEADADKEQAGDAGDTPSTEETTTVEGQTEDPDATQSTAQASQPAATTVDAVSTDGVTGEFAEGETTSEAQGVYSSAMAQGASVEAATTTENEDESAEATSGEVDYLMCKNPILDTNKFRDGKSVSAEKWKVVQAHVLQRHFDRWMYAHEILGDTCWPKQVNSTDDVMKHQCEDTERDSIWNKKDFVGDPYATPEKGHCNAKQLTLQGASHAEQLGVMLKQAYLSTDAETNTTPLFDGACKPEAVALASEDAIKNQLTLQYVYKGLCGELPTVEGYPAEAVISDGTLKRNTPFHIFPNKCNSTELTRLRKQGQKAREASDMWVKASELAKEVAGVIDHSDVVKTDTERSAELLDAVYDCMVSHACHGLQDVPEPLTKADTANAIDEYETKSRSFTFDWLKETNQTDLELYRKLTFGYYFRFLMDKMIQSTEGAKETKLSIEVVSDSTLTTVLAMLSARDTKAQEHRPPWGSTIVFEVYQSVDTSTATAEDVNTNDVAEYAVGVTYNGNLLDVCEPNENADLPDGACTWQQWTDLVETLSPTPEECPAFYIYYVRPKTDE